MEKVGAFSSHNFLAIKVCGPPEDSCSMSTQRSSGGGAKLCTLDMQSYLEVMGRQLDEIQAQHHQFYASRQDRLGKLRSQEHPGQLVKRWSSESHGAPLQPGGLPPEYPPPLGYSYSHGEREQLGSPCIGDNSGALPLSSATQSGARRSLLFMDGLSKASQAGSEHVNTQSPPGDGNMASAGHALGAASGASQACAELTVIVRDEARDAAAQQRSESPSEVSESTSVTVSITPQATSAGLLSNTPGTPSTHPGQSKTAMPSGVSPSGSSHSTPLGPYDTFGIPSVSYATPDSQNWGCPLTASASSSSPGAWYQSRTAAANLRSSSGLSALQGAAASQSTISVVSSQDTGSRGAAADVELLLEVASESDVSPYTLALPGRPFDGIDNEEDDDVQPTGRSYAGGNMNARGTAQTQALPDEFVGPHAEQPDDVSSQRVAKQFVVQQQPALPTAFPNSRLQSGTGVRAPLVAASLETEEALRVLLATPRFAMSHSGNVAASIDVEGLDVPADVLAALAKTDGMDLDAALGAAVAVSLREQSRLPLAPSAKQTQGPAGVGQTGQGRHMVLGPGALTAVPVAVSPAAAVRGFEISMRSAGGASVRAASLAGATPSAMSPSCGASHPQQQVDCPSAPIDAGIEVDRLNMLSRTVEVSVEGRALSTTDSAVFFALAAVQAAAAQQHSQPVLYSLAHKPSLPVDKGSRRNTLDGEGRRITLDGGSRCTHGGSGDSRRNTVDGCALPSEFSDAGQVFGNEHPHLRVHSAAHSALPTVIAGVSNAGRSDTRPVVASPSVGGIALGHGAAGSNAGRVPDGITAAASPVRGFRSSANMVSPSAASSIIRQGGDGDMVLYGSPSQRGDAGASPSPSASPYMAPSPPPGADPSTYTSSPTVTHMGSRLQRNSRKMDEDAVTGVRHDGLERGQAGVDDGVGTSGNAHSLRPLSAVVGTQSSSRRQLTQTGVSGTSSGPNSVHLDLSLTQAAAAVAIAGARPTAAGVQQPTPVAAMSPAVSQRQLRMQGSQHSPLLHKKYSEQQAVAPPAEVPKVPACSFSLAGHSPSSCHATEAMSFDMFVEGMGCPAMASSVARDSTSALPEPSGHSGDSNRTSRPQLQPLDSQVAAFSRAAALAAAVDVGMAAPLPALERRPAPPVVLSANTRSAPVEPVASVVPDAGATSRGPGTGWLNAAGLVGATGDSSTATGAQSRGLGKQARTTSGQDDVAADGRHSYLGHPELVQGQSPGPPSIASSAAKLTQLKARRQQQWQSQHGLQGSQSTPAVASAPQPQQSGAPHKEQQGFSAHHSNCSYPPSVSAADRNDGGTSFERQGGQVARQPFGNAPASAAVPELVSRPPLLVAISSPPMQGAATEARAPLACSKKEATIACALKQSQESGVSVTHEAGQVKWAWQTGIKSKPGPGRLDTTAAVPPSPGSCSNSSGSPWASPAAASAVVRDSGAEWALQQLPPPQWQRHGQMPAGRHSKKLQHEQPKQDVEGKPPLLQPRQQSGEYADGRRQSEYSIADRPATDAGANTHQYAISTGGVSAQEQNQLRVTSATEGGGQPNSKALALLRLKQQSIMRHNAQVNNVKELAGQPKAADEQGWHGAPLVHQGPRGRSNSASILQVGQQRQPPRQASASRALYTPEQGDVRQHGSEARVPEVDDVEMGDVDGAGLQVQPKPFLRRRSAKVEARRVDWSYVKPRTNSRNPDYYGDQNSPDALLKARASPLTSPGGGVAKPPLNINVGARAKKPGIKLPLTPTEGERTPTVPTTRRLSNIPPAPGGEPCAGATAERRPQGLGMGRPASGALSPLDDLLAHVNTLLRDFDKIVL